MNFLAPRLHSCKSQERSLHDESEIRALDKEAYEWSVPELRKVLVELKNVFDELILIANDFDETPARERLMDFCFKLTQKVSILELALESAKKKQEVSK